MVVLIDELCGSCIPYSLRKWDGICWGWCKKLKSDDCRWCCMAVWDISIFELAEIGSSAEGVVDVRDVCASSSEYESSIGAVESLSSSGGSSPAPV